MLTNRDLHHHRWIAYAASTVCLWAMVKPAAAQYGLALSPMRTELNLAAGAQRTGVLAIANEAKQEARFRAEILDVFIDHEAVPQFERNIPSEAAFSCKDWLLINPVEATVVAASQLPVRYTFRVPANAQPRTYHCSVAFTSLGAPGQQVAAVGIVAQLRLAATFYITVGSPVSAGETKEITVEKTNAPGTSGYRALITVENSGLTNLRCAGLVELLDSEGKVVHTYTFPPVVIFPSRRQRLPLVLTKEIPAGGYTLRTRVNLGTGEIQEATYRFRIPVD